MVVYLSRWSCFNIGDLLQQLFLRIRLERSASSQQFVQHHAQTENVAAAINSMSFPTGLFRTHVSRRPSVSWPLAQILLTQSQPEVSHIWFAGIVNQDIARLYVSVNQSLLVGM